MRPLQVSYIVILMLLLFGGFLLLESGKFLLPLGIYKPLFTIAILIDFFLTRRKVFLLPLLAGGVFLLFTSKFVLELFLGDAALFSWFSSGMTDWAMLLFVICLLIWALIELLSAREMTGSWLFFIGMLACVVCMLLNREEYACLGLLVSTAALYRNEARENTFSVSLLLFFLFTSATITGMVYGKLAVMANL